jgi:hypothetical protein
MIEAPDMRIIILLTAGFACLTPAGVSVSDAQPTMPGPTTTDDGLTILRRSLNDGGEVVVVRERRELAAGLSSLLGAPDAGKGGVVYEVRVELRRQGEPPVLLASRVRADHPDSPPGFELLDMLVQDGRVVVAASEGGTITVWEVRPTGVLTNHMALLGHHWSADAVSRTVNATQVSVVLNLVNGRITATIADKRFDAKQPQTTIMEQGDWPTFKLIKRSGGVLPSVR